LSADSSMTVTATGNTTSTAMNSPRASTSGGPSHSLEWRPLQARASGRRTRADVDYARRNREPTYALTVLKRTGPDVPTLAGRPTRASPLRPRNPPPRNRSA
jgi:hypothetical protein